MQCVHANIVSGVLMVAHVDEFLCYGPGAELRKLLDDVQTEFGCSGQMLGPGIDEVKVF